MKASSIGAAVPGTPSIAASPSYCTTPPGVRIFATMRAPVLTARMLMVVIPSAGSINPISMAAGPTPDRMLPQVGL